MRKHINAKEERTWNANICSQSIGHSQSDQIADTEGGQLDCSAAAAGSGSVYAWPETVTYAGHNRSMTAATIAATTTATSTASDSASVSVSVSAFVSAAALSAASNESS